MVMQDKASYANTKSMTSKGFVKRKANSAIGKNSSKFTNLLIKISLIVMFSSVKSQILQRDTSKYGNC